MKFPPLSSDAVPRRIALLQEPDVVRDALQQCLEAGGMVVETHWPAIAPVDGRVPDAIILCNPVAAVEAVAAIRGSLSLSGVPLIVLVADAAAATRWQAIAAGADEVLQEDVSILDMLAAIEARIRRATIHPEPIAGSAPLVDPELRAGALRRGDFLAQLAAVAREPDDWQVLIAVRLDQAASLVERLGPAVAFELEQVIATRLASELSAADAHTLWMEFGFGILARRDGVAEVEALAARLCAVVSSMPFELRGEALALTASVGVALAPRGLDAGDPDRWFASAHAAQSIAHRRGGNRSEGVLTRDHGDMPPERVLIIREWVKDAVAGDNVLVEFQPAVALRGGGSGLYTLHSKLRDYRAPLAGVPRREFLSLARAAGAMQMIDRMSLFAAFEAIEAERAAGRDTRVVVPMDLASIDEAQLRWMDAEVRRRRAHADGLLVEIDAAVALDSASLARVVQRLEEQGIVISLSDASGNLRNLPRLLRLPASLLRLPTQSLDAVDDDEFARLLAPWRANGRGVLVDGVENALRVRALWRRKVDYAQGDALAASGPRLDYEFTAFGG